jgi:hypothetical protein
MASVKYDLLLATHDDDNALAVLRGHEAVLRKCFMYVDEWYESHIDRDVVGHKIVSDVDFPPPTGINVNMMPISSARRDLHGMPSFCLPYLPMVERCIDALGYETFRKPSVMYLTINETDVPEGKTQRRGGLHIERPGNGAGKFCEPSDAEYPPQRFGLGEWCVDLPTDGIFMASNVSDTCAVWNARIKNPEDHGVTDEHGGIEHMRERLGAGTSLKAGELCWLTDTTPHEALPVPSATPRSFFRLVVGPLSAWHALHNTPNPVGVLPDCVVTYEDKFTGQPHVKNAP